MTSTLQGADIRGFYAALGVQLPAWAQTEAPARCFADPGAHAHEDRDPSCSVNLQSGAFNCHGCGAHGGAYDAALSLGRSPREAIDLMVAYGLTEPWERNRAMTPRRGARPVAVSAGRRGAPSPAPPGLAVTTRQVAEWSAALQATPPLLARLKRERGWRAATLQRLQVGFDGERVTVPIWRLAPSAEASRLDRGCLKGLLRLRVGDGSGPKVLAATGTRLGLMPPGTWEKNRSVVLVEGPSDMLAARSAGIAAIAVPGTHGWRREWARAFIGRDVIVVMDSDRPGREAAARIARDLSAHGASARIVDLAPGRDDGYDLSDWLREGNQPGALWSPGTGIDRRPGRTESRAGAGQAAGSAPPRWAPTGRSAWCATF